MFDLGRSFLASAERSPDAIAIIDGDVRLTYADWMDRVLRVVGAFDDSASSAATASPRRSRTPGKWPPSTGPARWLGSWWRP